jgi:hypothetical protein
MTTEIYRTAVDIFRNAETYRAVCLKCGLAVAVNTDPVIVCAADRQHTCASASEFQDTLVRRNSKGHLGMGNREQPIFTSN